MQVSIEQTRKRIEAIYIRQKKKLMKLELQHHLTPSTELALEMKELKGYVRGVSKALEHVEAFQNGVELPIDQEAGC
jgi:hypothetical protein